MPREFRRELLLTALKYNLVISPLLGTRTIVTSRDWANSAFGFQKFQTSTYSAGSRFFFLWGSLGRAFTHRQRKWRWPCREEGEIGWYGRVGKKARREKTSWVPRQCLVPFIVSPHYPCWNFERKTACQQSNIDGKKTASWRSPAIMKTSGKLRASRRQRQPKAGTGHKMQSGSVPLFFQRLVSRAPLFAVTKSLS